jgi:hypothetical protein
MILMIERNYLNYYSITHGDGKFPCNQLLSINYPNH